jgi:inositol oxygenase
MIDASELLRPEPAFATKPVVQFRDYTIDPTDHIKERVRKLYHEMHTHMTVDFVKGTVKNSVSLLQFAKRF